MFREVLELSVHHEVGMSPGYCCGVEFVQDATTVLLQGGGVCALSASGDSILTKWILNPRF